MDGEIKVLAEELKNETSLLVFGRGYNYATALEAALKVITFVLEYYKLCTLPMRHDRVSMCPCLLRSLMCKVALGDLKEAWLVVSGEGSRHHA